MKKLSWIVIPLLFALAVTLALNSRLDNNPPTPQADSSTQAADAVRVRQQRTPAPAALSASGSRAQPVERAGVTDIALAPSGGNDELLNQSLDDIKSLLVDMNTRMKQLEREVDGLQQQQGLTADTAADGAMSADADAQTQATVNRDTDKYPTAAQQQQRQAQQHYYTRLEQIVAADVDPVLSQQVETSYRDLLASREAWQQHAALNSAHCGSEYCKLSVTYSNDIDPQALFELDAGLIFANMDFPASTSRNLTRPDGSIEKILYFAKSQDSLPLFPN